MYTETIGVMGGFGAYAGLNFYRRMIETFSGDSERDIPHIIMDSDFTMPSRTRALLYGDDYDQVVKMMARSMEKLCSCGADHIIMACGTAHGFLNDVYKIYPEAQDKVFNIIDVLAKRFSEKKIERALIVAAEGTLKQKIYDRYLTSAVCVSPDEDDYLEIRYFIECVKQGRIDNESAKRWKAFLDKFGERNIVLGCTEFPVLVENSRKLGADLSEYVFWDPLEETLTELKKIIS